MLSSLFRPFDVTLTARMSAALAILLLGSVRAASGQDGQLSGAPRLAPQFHESVSFARGPTRADAQARKSYWLAGAAIGFAGGAAVTAVVLHSGGSTSLCDRSANQDAMSSSECLGLTFLGGVAGAAIGGFVGSRIHARTAADAPRQGFRLLPRRDGSVQLDLFMRLGIR
ncbi:MAG TPA: hypothetical protein VF021_02670 [Longimicrobiales bacterium]